MTWQILYLLFLWSMLVFAGRDALLDHTPLQWRGRPRLEWWQSAVARRRAWGGCRHHMDTKFTVRSRRTH